MNVDEVLIAVQNFRSQLELWGVSPLTLVLAGTVSLVVFFFSLREVFVWYFKIHLLRHEIRSLREELKELKKVLKKTLEIDNAALGEGRTADSLTSVLLSPEKSESAPTKFRFDH